VGQVKLNLKEFTSDLVTRKAYNLPISGDDCYLKATVCIDQTENEVNVKKV